MYKKLSYLLFWVMLTSTGQACAASENKKKTSQVSQSQTTESQNSNIPVAETRDATYASSRYKPTGLLVSLDFQEEEVKPVKGTNGMHDMLVFRTPTGEASAADIFYEDGKKADRRARVTAGPQDKNNRALHFWLKNARIPGQKKGMFKGRVELAVPNLNWPSAFQRFRLYLHPDLKFYRQYPKESTWFSINEFWMGTRWGGHPFPFRISLNIAKPAGVGKPLYFTATSGVPAGGTVGKGNWRNIWAKVGLNFEVPLGEWLDVEIGYKQGNRKTGRFYMGVKRENDKHFTTVIDVTNWTYNPKSPVPVPLTNWNPAKLYTSSKIVDFVRKKSGVTQMYWDDFEIFANW